ncbi:hypothetical protein CFP56_008189 [Quercus suber]|uniref:RING-CH-type domain-containing protein n=1 Tax=Quercus suber TaxID=58331 RepID=A0AAW0L5Q1_QUESU
MNAWIQIYFLGKILIRLVGIDNLSMGDHFVLLVDRLITESTLEAAIESRNKSLQATSSVVIIDEKKIDHSSKKVDFASHGKVVECRICQDEDEDSNMNSIEGKELIQGVFGFFQAWIQIYFLGKILIRLVGIDNLSMGDHFVLLVDRLITESTLEAAIESRNKSLQATSSVVIIDEKKIDHSSKKVDFASHGKVVECRICQDEDEDSNMETPCSCCGSLKYAHRRCVQRWCNEKGDTMGNWEIYRRDSNSPRVIAMVSANRSFLEPDYDEYSASTTRSLMCFRSVALIFMVLLILRHTLPLIISGGNGYSFPLSMLLFLRTAGIILPIYIMVRAVTFLQRRRYQQEPSISPIASSDDEIEDSTLQPQPHIIRVQV